MAKDDGCKHEIWFYVHAVYGDDSAGPDAVKVRRVCSVCELEQVAHASDWSPPGATEFGEPAIQVIKAAEAREREIREAGLL